MQKLRKNITTTVYRRRGSAATGARKAPGWTPCIYAYLRSFWLSSFFFQRNIGSVTPCDMILLWTPLFPEGKGQTNHADACEKFVCPNIPIPFGVEQSPTQIQKPLAIDEGARRHPRARMNGAIDSQLDKRENVSPLRPHVRLALRVQHACREHA